MHIRVIGIVLAALVLTAAPLSTQTASAQDRFVFTAIPDQDETRLRTRFEKVARYLSDTLGVDVQYVPV